MRQRIYQLIPLAAASDYPAPAFLAPYEEAFRCPFQWNSNFNAFPLRTRANG
jgi:hypothetical protein